MQSVDTAVTDVATATKKFFRRVLPIMLVMLVCNQLNRSNIGYAQAQLEADVGIGAAAYGLGAGLFFIAYAIFELPSNVMMEKYGAKIWLSRIMVSWGIVSFLMAFVQNETMFFVLRFLLGAAEAGFFPAVIFYFARWVPAGQRGKATAIFIAGSSVAAAISGPIAGMLLSLHDVLGLRGWQWLFGFEGLLSVVVGAVVFFLLDAKVQDAKWLSSGEKSALSAAIAAEDARHAGRQARTCQPLEDAPEPADPAAVRHLLRHPALRLRQHLLAPQHHQADPGNHGPQCRIPVLHSVGVRHRCHVLRGQVAGQGASPSARCWWSRCWSPLSGPSRPPSPPRSWRWSSCPSPPWASRAHPRCSGPSPSRACIRWSSRRPSPSSTRWETWAASWRPSGSASSRSRREAWCRGSSPSPRPLQPPPAWSISSRNAEPQAAPGSGGPGPAEIPREAVTAR